MEGKNDKEIKKRSRNRRVVLLLNYRDGIVLRDFLDGLMVINEKFPTDFSKRIKRVVSQLKKNTHNE